MKILNFTPHTVNIIIGESTTAITSNGIARVSATEAVVGIINDIPLVETIYGQVEGLPEQQEDTIIIVSRLVLSAVSDRTDLVVPAGQVRDAEGKVIGCTGLAKS